MVAIRIECTGGSFLIDEQQWAATHECQLPNGEWLSKRPCDLKWRIRVQPHADYVVYTYRRLYQVAMHRLLLGASKGQSVDHKNHDGTDNRMQNIRRTAGKWESYAVVDKRKILFGFFTDEIEAAMARDNWVRLHRPEFGYLNLPSTACEVAQ